MTLSKRERIVALLAGLTIGALLLDQTMLTPWFNRLNKANDMIAAHQSKLLDANNLFSSDTAAQRRWKEMAGNGLKSDASASEGQLLDRVREAAQQAGLSLQSLKPERSERVSGFYRITIRVTANGSMWRVSRFMESLQRSKIPLRLTDVQITARKEGTDDLSLQMGVSTIFDPPPVPGARVAGVHPQREALQ